MNRKRRERNRARPWRKRPWYVGSRPAVRPRWLCRLFGCRYSVLVQDVNKRVRVYECRWCGSRGYWWRSSQRIAWPKVAR